MKARTQEEAIAKASREANGAGYIDFDGQNCDDEANCLGWDGESRRCDCGNRRVSWFAFKDQDGYWHAYAEAY